MYRTKKEVKSMKKFCFGLLCVGILSPAVAMDCADGKVEKLIKIDAARLDTNMYNKKVSADTIESWDYKLVSDSYNGGRWSLKNEKDDNLNVSGVAICIDSDENFDFKRINRGPYCWCGLRTIDNYDVSSDWRYAREYKSHKFDENKYAGKPDKARQAEREAKEKNIQDCLNKCSESCQGRHGSMIHKINGFYKCDSAVYKLQNARCVIDDKYINAKSILVFDDIAEIQKLGGGSIVFTRDDSNKNAFDYVGKYDGENLYLRLKNKQIYIGRKTYLMKECY